jgi:hypothetical protein
LSCATGASPISAADTNPQADPGETLFNHHTPRSPPSPPATQRVPSCDGPNQATKGKQRVARARVLLSQSGFITKRGCATPLLERHLVLERHLDCWVRAGAARPRVYPLRWLSPTKTQKRATKRTYYSEVCVAPSGRHSLARAAGAPRAGGAAPSGRHSTLECTHIHPTLATRRPPHHSAMHLPRNPVVARAARPLSYCLRASVLIWRFGGALHPLSPHSPPTLHPLSHHSPTTPLDRSNPAVITQVCEWHHGVGRLLPYLLPITPLRPADALANKGESSPLKPC